VAFVSRILLLAGAAGLALAAVVPWVTIKGLGLELGPIGAEVAPGARTVHGTDTSLWPVVLGVGAIVAVLALLNVARKVLLLLGLGAIAGGTALLYYLSNVIEIESGDGSKIEQLLTSALVSSSVGPGAPLLVAGGVAIVAGALLARR
jgi:hypothetical protein